MLLIGQIKPLGKNQIQVTLVDVDRASKIFESKIFNIDQEQEAGDWLDRMQFKYRYVKTMRDFERNQSLLQEMKKEYRKKYSSSLNPNEKEDDKADLKRIWEQLEN